MKLSEYLKKAGLVDYLVSKGVKIQKDGLVSIDDADEVSYLSEEFSYLAFSEEVLKQIRKLAQQFKLQKVKIPGSGNEGYVDNPQPGKRNKLGNVDIGPAYNLLVRVGSNGSRWNIDIYDSESKQYTSFQVFSSKFLKEKPEGYKKAQQHLEQLLAKMYNWLFSEIVFRDTLDLV